METKNTLYDILTQREDFLVVGLTGRLGSGCSKVAEVMSTPYDKMNFPHLKPQAGQNLSEQQRTLRIIGEFAEEHWLKFDVIHVGAIIATFVLKDDSRFIRDLSVGKVNDFEKHRIGFREEVLECFCRKVIHLCLEHNLLGGDGDDRNQSEMHYIKAPQNLTPQEIETWIQIRSNLYVANLKTQIFRANMDKALNSLWNKLQTIRGLEHELSQMRTCFVDGKNNAERDDEQRTKPFSQILHLTEDVVDSEAIDWKQVGLNMSYLYREVLLKCSHVHRRKYLECVDELLELLAIYCLVDMINETRLHKRENNAADLFWNWISQIDVAMVPNSGKRQGDEKAPKAEAVLQIQKFVFAKYITPWFGLSVRSYMQKTLGADAYSRLFQRYGQMIRYYSRIKPYGDEKHIGKDDIFAIPRRINQYIKILRHPFLSYDHRPVRIVVDSIKNVFEAVYLRYRYSAFYLWAITTDSEIRERRLRYKHLTDTQVRKMDWNEYPDKGGQVIIKVEQLLKQQSDEVRNNEEKKRLSRIAAMMTELEKLIEQNMEECGGAVSKGLYNTLKSKVGDISSLMAAETSKDPNMPDWQTYDFIASKLGEAEADFYMDRVFTKKPDYANECLDSDSEEYFREYEEFNLIRREFFKGNTYAFYTQDVNSCVCNADVYLFNNADIGNDIDNNRKLREEIVRNVSLVMYPGLVRPTPVERCMQIALSAKVNSGCLSRQVGAVVTDSEYNILAIGWNDVPCGEVPCAYKNAHDVVAEADQVAYSDYELFDDDFRNRIRDYKLPELGLMGLPFNYCFKAVHKKIKDPMRSRAMHAEEKALALCGRETEGGYLFTTSSPCEMCSKNAKNHKIRKVYYLEAYPGIAQDQYNNSGAIDNRAELVLFSGAIGRAYMQMYTPLLPHKDVLDYLDVTKADY